MAQAGRIARILVVGADARVRALVARTLGGEGYGVRGAADAAAALALAEAARPALVLVDLSRPGTGGRAFVRALRGRGIDVPILALAAAPDPAAAARAIGAADWLATPVDPDALLAMVTRRFTPD